LQRYLLGGFSPHPGRSAIHVAVDSQHLYTVSQVRIGAGIARACLDRLVEVAQRLSPSLVQENRVAEELSK
jgi:hypothetical protein